MLKPFFLLLALGDFSQHTAQVGRFSIRPQANRAAVMHPMLRPAIADNSVFAVIGGKGCKVAVQRLQTVGLVLGMDKGAESFTARWQRLLAQAKKPGGGAPERQAVAGQIPLVDQIAGRFDGGLPEIDGHRRRFFAAVISHG